MDIDHAGHQDPALGVHPLRDVLWSAPFSHFRDAVSVQDHVAVLEHPFFRVHTYHLGMLDHCFHERPPLLLMIPEFPENTRDHAA